MMRHGYTSIALPAAEHARLQRLMLTMIGSSTPLATILRRKLGSARVVRGESIGQTALSGSRVTFSIDGEPARQRVLTWDAPHRAGEDELSLLSSRGLALIGLVPGQSISYRTASGRTEFLELEGVDDAEASGVATRDAGSRFVSRPQQMEATP